MHHIHIYTYIHIYIHMYKCQEAEFPDDDFYIDELKCVNYYGYPDAKTPFPYYNIQAYCTFNGVCCSGEEGPAKIEINKANVAKILIVLNVGNSMFHMVTNAIKKIAAKIPADDPEFSFQVLFNVYSSQEDLDKYNAYLKKHHHELSHMFSDAITQNIEFAPGQKLEFWHKKVTPRVAQRYDYIWVLDEDLGFAEINIRNFFRMIIGTGAIVSQPILQGDSWWEFTKYSISPVITNHEFWGGGQIR